MENTLQHIFSTDYDQETFFSGVLEYVFGAENITRQEFPEEFISSDADRNLAETANIHSIKKVGGIEGFFDDFSIFDITLGDNSKIAYSRVNIQNVLRKKLRGENAFLLFHYQNSEGKEWRLSYLYSYGKSSTDSKRFTYLLGSQHNARTVTERFSKLREELLRVKDDETKGKELLEEAFSVEALTKEFYNRVYEWFLRATDKEKELAYFPNMTDTDKDDFEHLEIHIIRFLTRIMFVWFIKQKDLVDEKLFKPEELKTILKDFDPYDKKSSQYYNAILQNLFFATLNCEIKGRAFAEALGHRDSKSLYRYDELFNITKDEIKKLFSSIPFLNGGLFECLDKDTQMDGVKLNIDGFSRNDTKNRSGRYTNRAFIANSLFFEKDNGLFDIFRQYNFTVEENTPLEQAVALDPELLGKVFENLLGAFNPETQETARNDSGSFYTPREIVGYMADQSIRQYLINQGVEEGFADRIFKEDFEPYITVDETDKGALQKMELNLVLAEEYKNIVAKLKAIKILDPACGSGAFPMGILNRITDIIAKLSPEDAKDIHALKLHIIENCIFGSDIQQIAVQICKLRFFISLICDVKKDETKDNFGISPLPNLETKFVCADSLISPKISGKKDSDLDFNLVQPILDKLLKVRESHFSARSRDEKITLREKDEKLRTQLKERLSANKPVETEQVSHLKNIIDYYENLIKRLEKQNQSMADNYATELLERSKLTDTGISLPPLENYLQNKTFIANRDNIAKNKKELEKHKAKLAAEQKKTQKLTGNSANDDAAKEVADWNPYDQNQQCTWFSPKYMFDIDGFDIIIGNPPYIQLQNNGGKLANQYKDCGYESFAKTGDIYCLFYERAHQLLKDGGLCSFITSNKWMRAGYGEAMRKFFADKTNPLLLIDFAGVKVFDSATVDTNILIYAKNLPQNQTLACSAKTLSKQDLKNLDAFVKGNTVECSFPSGDSWVILSPIEQSIKRKIEAVGTPLKDWDIQINYGIKTGYNEAFIITTKERNEILAACQTDEERQKTAEIIRPILRGRDIKRYGYDWAGLYLIATFPSKKYDIDELPAIKNHLLSFGKERLEQTGKKYNGFTARKKTNNKWFETQDSIAYWDDFDKPKIVYPDIAQKLSFVADEKGYILGNTAYFFTCKDSDAMQFLLKVLNSKLIDWYYRTLSVQLGEKAVRMFSIYVLKIPIIQSVIELPTIDTEIDRKVCELYGLDKDEMSFIETYSR